MHPNEGQVRVFGYDSKTHSHEIQKLIGYMPQRFGLYQELSVYENLLLNAKLKNLPHSEQKQRFDELLHLTNLKPFENRLAGKLSGGMKQKLGLCCALLTRPRLLILDEPGVGVDPLSRMDLWNLISSLTHEGIGVLWSTAYLEEAENCHETILLNNGKKIFQGAPEDFTQLVKDRVYHIRNLSNPRGFLREILKHNAVMDGFIQGHSVRLVLRHSDIPADIINIIHQEQAEIVSTTPHFEDAFIDHLGGIGDGISRIAEAIRPTFDHDESPVIEAHSLTKTFGPFIAANQISFSIKRGEIFGLLGPNGAGKSTTFKMLCGLLTPDTGYSKIVGQDFMQNGNTARMQLGYMAQKFSLYDDLSVKQNLNFFAGLYGLSKSKRQEKIAMMLELFDLEKYSNNQTETLPLGLKQRLALAAALMHEPRALFLDEPTSGIDPIARREFWMHINGLVEKGVTVLVTTHFMEEAEYCDRIALIYRGRTIALDTPDALKNAIATPDRSNPTMEDAFIELIRADEKENPL